MAPHLEDRMPGGITRPCHWLAAGTRPGPARRRGLAPRRPDNTRKRNTGPGTLGATVHVIARMGGYLNRKHDSAPGVPIFREGYRSLAGMAEGLERAKRLGKTADAYPYLNTE